MKSKHFYLSALFCLIIALSSCKDNADSPLRFYDNSYEVPMGGVRYLGLESGNGSYTLEVGDAHVASAQSESGWTTPGGSAIYIRGILTGKTYLKVTDNDTQENCILQIKVTDSYVTLRLSHKKDMNTSLQNVSDLFFMNNKARDVYFFKKASIQTAFSPGIELLMKGRYDFEQSNGQSYLTLSYAEDTESQIVSHRFILPDTQYVLHHLNKNLNLGWDTTPVNYSRTSPVPEPSFTMKEDSETGNEVDFGFIKLEMPPGILP